MSKTTMIYRNANYQSRAKCAKSLNHSLRIKTDAFKPDEWIEELADSNKVYSSKSPDGTPLTALSEDKKMAHIEQFLDREFAPNTASPKVRSDFSKYQYKLKKKIETADMAGFDALKNELQHILENKPDDYADRIDGIEGVKRKGQLVSMLDKYIALSKKMEGTADLRESKVHEAFFKFPHQHGVTPDHKRMAECMRSFYETHAKDYKIGLLVVHDDERKPEQTTGAHPHIFVSTKNSKTGERDLAKQLRSEANKHLKANPTEVELWNAEKQMHETKTVTNIDLDCANKYAATKLQGMVIQDMFMAHVRAKFPELTVEWSKEREHKVKAFNEHYEDAKKPKADRTYNLSNYLQEDNTKLTNDNKLARSAIAKQKQIHAKNKAYLEKEKKHLDTITQDITQAEERLGQIDQEVDSKFERLSDRLNDFMKKYYSKLINGITNKEPTEQVQASADLCVKKYQLAGYDEQSPIMKQVRKDQEELQAQSMPNDERIDIHSNMVQQMENNTKQDPSKNRSPTNPKR